MTGSTAPAAIASLAGMSLSPGHTANAKHLNAAMKLNKDELAKAADPGVQGGCGARPSDARVRAGEAIELWRFGW